MKKQTFTQYIKDFDFEQLFNDLGWDNFNNQLPVAVNEDIFALNGIAVKKGFVILHCPPIPNGKIPISSIRKQIENKVAKNYFEHLIIYSDKDKKQQIWQLAIKEENKPKQVREVSWYSHQDVESLFQRMKNLLFTLDEEETITIVDVKQRIAENFAKNSDQVTKKFYTEFKKQHVAFLDFINGIDDHIGNKENENKQWYASLMLNRLMFCYFIQKKGFLDQDFNYLQNKLKQCEQIEGQTNFYSFYRSFLLELFHDGLGKPLPKRKSKLPVVLGKIPYLNGGLFDVHELERQFEQIEIQDDAFKKIFDFFDQWNWHLDNSIEATGKDINPDVIGYIFEKYINDRAAMGAYYTKEDITDYIGKNTIIPFLFDETERHYKEGFKADSELWKFLKNSSTTYIYDAVKHGIPDSEDLFADLPDDVKSGINHSLENVVVNENKQPHLWEIRQTWNQKTPENTGLPTEIYRELIERRNRFSEIKGNIENGDLKNINDFITYNLNIRQFAQDFIESTEDATFVRLFYKAINKITILDPTCGSGAFLFASLNILEPLYEACITRMEQFIAEQPGKHKFFEETLADVNNDNHPNLQYFIYKSIILNNLYGVDIMHEAVEIAKLRLFLKLVTTVDVSPRKENFGLEPLPDIDFNIRAGNTLIGFATESELLQTIQKKEPLFAADKLEEFKEEFELVSKAFSHFQNSQLVNDQGSDSFKAAKAQLLGKLKELNDKLNVYLATNYGIDAQRHPKEFYTWLQSHQPFHWFAEFYHIVSANGGFDCIIGNPPYVVYNRKDKTTKKAIQDIYKIQGYYTLPTNNLYAFTIERAFLISSTKSVGMIVPLTSVSNNNMDELRKLLADKGLQFYSHFEIRPAKLFDGVDQRLTIFITRNNSDDVIYSTQIKRWGANERSILFQSLYYGLSFYENRIWRLEYKHDLGVYNKFVSHKEISSYLSPSRLSNNAIHYRTAGARYWIIFTNNGFDSESVSNKSNYFLSEFESMYFMALLNSNLFWWYYATNFDMFNIKDYMIFSFKNNYKQSDKIEHLSSLLQINLDENKKSLVTNSATNGRTESFVYKKKSSKPIIDQIDTVLAEHYGFTEAELDFIINYDIKYRMGKSLFGETDDDTEEDED